jgi:4a-hydroxytetrahydrobiopterin dehydratase
MSDFKPTNWSGVQRSSITVSELQHFLEANPGWAREDNALEKTYRFANHFEALAFANAVAWIAHRQDHHPEQNITYNTVTLRWNTHDVKGISHTDFACARACDALLTV